MTGSFNLIGKRLPLVDSRPKVTGEGGYTDDITLPSMLVGKILRSPHAHARVRRVDFSRAENIPGVRACVDGRESRVKFGVLPVSKDETAFAVEKTIYVGDQVAAVAAESEAIANRALKAIRVEYEPLPAYLKMEESLSPGEVIHPETKRADNVHKAVEQSFGDTGAAFREAKHRASAEFAFAGLNHAFTEPHCVIAHYDTEGRLTVWSATQVPHYLHRALSEVMEMPMHRIRVVKPLVGGGFGGKSDPFPHEMAAAILSRRTRRPVKILFDREEVFLLNHGRHPTKTKVALSMDERGHFTGMEVNALIDGGAWGSFGVVSTYYNGVLSQGPYGFDTFRYSGKRVYSNKPPSGAMRGHGSVNTRFAIEVLIDEMAAQAGIDPIELRLRNCLKKDSKTLNEFRITSIGIEEALVKVRDASGWRDKHGQLPYGRGIGVACGFYISGSAHRIHRNRFPQSTAHLKIDMDGAVIVHCGAADIGQGSDTMLAQCVAEVLGVEIGRVKVKAQDSDTAPFDLGSYSSRVTFMAGNAAKQAAERVRDTLLQAARKITGAGAGEAFTFHDEAIVSARDPAVRVTFDEALFEAMADHGALLATGMYGDAPPMGGGDKWKGSAAGLAPSYSYQAFIAEVEVDPETGFVTVEHVWAAHDCGRALNPLAVEGQIEGSIHMGLGQALQEEMVYHKGTLLNANLLDYRPLTSKQMPKVEVFIVESIDPEGPFGAKECGEGALAPIIPAVANAIHDAVGVRLYETPMTPDKVFAALERARGPAPARARARAGTK
ncbi:MAG: molybdopterin-dependent oxidoreductase [Planctomycetes bacterium]|nr:molybdopterin-dependent oxidoreductase [Planctomycetota bacterium]